MPKSHNVLPFTKKRTVRGTSLDDLAEQLRWVTWREEMQPTKNGPTKLPYDPATGRLARIPSEPATWNTRAKAERLWQQLDDGSRGGIGIVLGDLDDKTILMGIDLDCCIDPETRNIAPWADEILGRFNSYAEVSPSDQGIKLFFLVAAKDAAAIDGLFGKNPKGEPMLRRAFGAGKHREIAIDRGRYYAVTGWKLNDVPETLRTVAADDVRWFIEDAGPRYKALHKPAGDTITTPTARPRDESGSGHGFRFLGECKAAGDDFETALRAILDDEGEAGEWARRVDERQLFRAWANQLILPPSAPLIWANEFVARKFVRDGTSGLRHYRGGFYEWTGTHYEECDDDHLRSLIYRFLSQAMTVRNKKVVPFNPDQTKVNKLIDALKGGVNENAKHDAPFWIDDREHPDSRNLIACKNGLLDITTRQLLPHTPLLFNVTCLPFAYDADAEAPRWMEFLRQIWPGDQGSDGEEAEFTLQEIFGYLLTPDTSQQKMFLFEGAPRSGRGTIARVVTALLGKENIAAPTLAQLGTDFGLASLIDKRVAIIADARLGSKNAHVVVERLLSISGEDTQDVNRKYRPHWIGRLGARILILTNELPRVTDQSGAFVSRFIVLIFRESFLGKEDPELTGKLLQELPGILNWALAGWDRLCERGHFVTPKSSMEATRQFEDLTSPVKVFVREWCIVGADEKVSTTMLYDAYRHWCV